MYYNFQEFSDVHRIDVVVHVEPLAYGEVALPVAHHPDMLVETYGRIASVDVELHPASARLKLRKTSLHVLEKTSYLLFNYLKNIQILFLI